MDCRRYQDDLSVAASGSELTPERQRALGEHLRRCSACAARLDRQKRALEAIDRVLAEGAEAAASPELVRRIERKLAKPSRSALPAGALATAAAVLALATAMWLLRPRMHPQPLRPAEPVQATNPGPAPNGSSKQTHGSLAPLVATARIRPGTRHGRRRTLPTEDSIFELASFPAEKQAVDRLYELAASHEIDAQTLQLAPAAGTEDLAPAPLTIQPLAIPPLKTDSLANAQPEPQTSVHFPGKDTEAQKEMKR
jgi:hypothetical protein